MNFLQRTPFAIAGAIGLLSLGSDVIEFEKHITAWIHVWQSVTYPVMDFLFGWIFSWLDWRFPGWLKDYLMVGFVCLGGFIRAMFVNERTDFLDSLRSLPYMLDILLYKFLFWPIGIYRILADNYILVITGVSDVTDGSIIEQYTYDRIMQGKYNRKIKLIFLETFIYTLLIIAASYALIFSGVSSPAAS